VSRHHAAGNALIGRSGKASAKIYGIEGSVIVGRSGKIGRTLSAGKTERRRKLSAGGAVRIAPNTGKVRAAGVFRTIAAFGPRYNRKNCCEMNDAATLGATNDQISKIWQI